MALLICVHCEKSLITPILKQELQMRSILEAFNDTAHLYFDVIIDKLIAARVLQTKHHTILTAQGDRTHFARKLWTLLLRLPPRKFKKHVEPLLEECGFFQGQQQVHLKTHMCLRCVIEHMVPIEDLADKLMVHGCLRAGEHRDAIKSNMVEISKWKVVFESLKRQYSHPQVLRICQDMLQEFEIPVPADFNHILRNGTVCVCGIAGDSVSKRTKQTFPPASGPLCTSCQRHFRGQTVHEYLCHPNQQIPEVFHADFAPPSDDAENDAEIRHRSCRSFRKRRMVEAQCFQRDVLKPANSGR